MKVYEKLDKLNVETDVDLEVKSYYSQKNVPTIVSVTGLGGCAGKDCVIDYLARDYQVVTFSPRNSGSSNGHLTLENYALDTLKVIDYVSQIDGERPYGIGHSMGGYTLGRLLGEIPLVKKAVLLAPLIDITEQNPDWFNNYIRNNINREKVPGAIQLGLFFSNNLFGFLGNQRFDQEDSLPFLKSLYNASECSNPLLCPTQVILAGRANNRFKIKNVFELSSCWENLGAKVAIYSELNHWFSGVSHSGVGVPFSLCKKEGITKIICDFFKD